MSGPGAGAAGEDGTLSTRLAAHFLASGYAGLAASHLHEMKRLLLDWVGVAIAGSATASGSIASRCMAGMGGEPEATLIAAGGRVPMTNAAYANAVCEHSVELDDIDELAYFHYGPPVVSAALAVAERRASSGHDLLVALLAGCEMMNWLSLAANPGMRDRGFHTTPACGVFGATVAAARLRGADEPTLVNALGLAGAHAGGLMEMYGPSMQKRINPGPAARDGILAVELARAGFTGADTILEGEHGFGQAFSSSFDGGRLLAGLGSEVPVKVEFKPYSAARPIHNAIDCALNIRGRRPLALEEIESIEVHRHPRWADYHANPAPASYHEAQVSLPYSVAIALADGRAFPDQYADDQLGRGDVMALARQVEIRPQPDLRRGVSCRLVLTLRSGEVLEETVDDPKGSVGNPLADAELEGKLHALADGALGAAAVAAVAERIWNLEADENAGSLVPDLAEARSP